MIPFAVVGSDHEYQVNGKRILGRKTKWGTIEGSCPLAWGAPDRSPSNAASAPTPAPSCQPGLSWALRTSSPALPPSRPPGGAHWGNGGKQP